MANTQALTVKENCTRLESALMKDQGKALMDWLDQDKNMCARYIACTKAMMHKNKALGECTVPSIYTAVLAAAQCGLLPDGQMGALVPYNNKIPGTNQFQKEAAFQPMVRGLVELVYASSDKVQKIWGEIVYKADQFDYGLGPDQYIKHKPATGARGNPIGCYMFVVLRDGTVFLHYMGKEDIEAHGKAFSKAFEDKYKKFWKHPINKFAMWKKTVFRQMWTWIPKGLIQGPAADPKQAKAIEHMKASEQVEFEDITDTEEEVEEVKVTVVKSEEPEPTPPEDEPAPEPKKETPKAKPKPDAKAKAAPEPKPALTPPRELVERADLLEWLCEHLAKTETSDEALQEHMMEACMFFEFGEDQTKLEELDTDSLRQLKEHLKNG